MWDLVAGKFVRSLKGTGTHCSSIIALPGGRVAVGWYTRSSWLVEIFDTRTGKPRQTLMGFQGFVLGLAHVEDHFLTLSGDYKLRVWSETSSGKVRCECLPSRGLLEVYALVSCASFGSLDAHRFTPVPHNGPLLSS